MGKTSTATKNKWNSENYDQLRVIVKKGQREIIKAYAEDDLGPFARKIIAALREEEVP